MPDEQRKEAVKKWISNKYNLILIIILLIAVILRLYYFNITDNQPLWWDEAAYGSLAKNNIHHLWDETHVIVGEEKIRPPLFPLLWSILLRVNFGEAAVRFILEFLPSILSVFVVYLIGAELYNKRVGLISSFMFSVLWIHLFYTNRLMTDIPALFFIFVGIYYFIKSTKDNFNGKYFAIALIASSIGTLFRYPHGLIFFAYLVFLIITWRIDLLKKKKFWISGIIGISPILLFFAINYINTGEIFPALAGGDYGGAVKESFDFNILSFIPAYLKRVFFIFFLIGGMLALAEIVIGYDQLKTNKKLQSHLLLALIMIIMYYYFVFYIKGAEDRWVFVASISMIVFSALGIDFSSDYASKFVNNKNIIILLIMGVLLFGAYSEIKFADSLVKEKKETYTQLKEGYSWINQNTNKEDKIIIQGMEVYALYYGERVYEVFPTNYSDLANNKGNYMIVQGFSPQPDYINQYLQENPGRWTIVNALFFDSEQKQMAFVVLKKTEV
mgnify:CR=1 FL=1